MTGATSLYGNARPAFRRSRLAGEISRVVLAMALGSTTVGAHAGLQDMVYTNLDIVHGLPGGNDLHTTAVDIDNDGDLDIFIGTGSGTIRYFLNTGSGTEPVYTEQTGAANPFEGVDVGNRATPVFVDIDNDGDFDAFVGESTGAVHYFENTGSAVMPVFSPVAGPGNPLASLTGLTKSVPEFVDIDGDGDFDVFLGAHSGDTFFAENTGSASSPVFSLPPLGNPFGISSVGFYSVPHFVDVDADGDFDVFIGAKNGLISFFENTGDSGAPAFTKVTGSGNPFDGLDLGGSSRVFFADFDGDGDFDGLANQNPGKPRLYRNAGDAANMNLTLQNPLAEVHVNYLSRPAFVDIDGDGDWDAFVVTYYGTILFYENTGDGNTAAFVRRTGAENPLNGVNVGVYGNISFVDIDNDGDADVFAGTQDGTFRFFENTGSAPAAAFTQRVGALNPLDGEDAGDHSTVSFADIDDDGDFDAFAGAQDGSVHFYENTGTAGAALFSEVAGAANPFDGVAVAGDSFPWLGDIDGDGDYDALVGDYAGDTHTFENTGTAASAVLAELAGGADPLDGQTTGWWVAPAMVDIDGDGDLDLFIGQYAGTIDYIENITEADLEITQSDAPDPVLVGGDITFTLSVANNGPDGARSIVVSDVLPAGAAFVSATADDGGACSESAGVVSCRLHDMADGARTNIDIVVTALSVTSLSNQASVAAYDVDPVMLNNSSVELAAVDPVADLHVSQSELADPVFAGQTITYNLSVGNDGPNSATSVVVTDTLAAQVEFVSAAPADGGTCSETDGVVTCNLNDIASGDSVAIPLTVRTTIDGTATNSVTVSAAQADTNAANNSSSETTGVDPSAGLAVSASPDLDAVPTGTTATVTLTVSNNGPSESADVVLNSLWSGTMDYFTRPATGQGSCSQSGDLLTCALGMLSSGQSVDVAVMVTANEEGSISYTAEASSTTMDPDAGDNSVTGEVNIHNAPAAGGLAGSIGGGGAFGPWTLVAGLLAGRLKNAARRHRCPGGEA